jgi:glutathione synthase/RimK-type ligase-like ATP-grasp enzyme
MILIISTSGDLHALCVQRELSKRAHINSSLFCIDRIVSNSIFSLSIGTADDRVVFTDADGRSFCLSDARVIWLRRLRIPDASPRPSSDTKSIGFVETEARSAVAAMINMAKPAVWISEPGATFRASDRIYQLSVANDCGFRVPATIVSQSRREVMDFAAQLRCPIVVKAVAGTHPTFLLTRFLGDPADINELAYQACPAIYQEFIPGTRHIRLNCFGDRSYAAMLETEELDWRPNLSIPISSVDVPEELHRAVRKVLDALELSMGVIDIKLTPEGEYVWLEVNPQGQFLFLDALTDLNLIERFSDYLAGAAVA